jgi:hypothetical protein
MAQIESYSSGIGRFVKKTGDTMSGILNHGNYAIIGGTGVNDILKLQGTTGNGTTANPAIQFLVGNNGGTTAVTILNNGRIGINKADPTAPLHIVDASAPGIKFEKTGSGAGIGHIYNDAYFNFVGPGSSPSRSFTFYDCMRAGNGANVATPAFSNFNDTNTGLYFVDNADKLGLVTGATERLRVENNGYVGINETTPGAMLQVVPNAVGTIGTIIKGKASQTADLLQIQNSSATILLNVTAAGALAISGVAVPTISSTNTLTNKRVTPRAGTVTSSATPTINTDNYDYYSLTAQSVDITSFSTNLSGSPTDGQKLWISITGTASRAIAWGASFEASTVALPTTTVSTNRLDVGFIWNIATSKWRCMAAG